MAKNTSFPFRDRSGKGGLIFPHHGLVLHGLLLVGQREQESNILAKELERGPFDGVGSQSLEMLPDGRVS